MADGGGEFTFIRGIHVRTDIRVDISISLRTMTTKFSKHLHLEELTQMILVEQMLVTLKRQDHVTRQKHISTTRVPMITKLGRMVTYLHVLLP